MQSVNFSLGNYSPRLKDLQCAPDGKVEILLKITLNVKMELILSYLVPVSLSGLVRLRASLAAT